MSRRIFGTVICAGLALLCLPALALARPGPAGQRGHTISVSPTDGDFGTLFRFTGRGWQPRKGGTVGYFVSEDAKQPVKTYRFRPDRRGRFVFRFTQPAVADTGAAEVLCFRQRDTRFRRSFTACAPFYVEAPRAYFMPSEGRRGDIFVLVMKGFTPGDTLQGTVFFPDGTTDPFTDTTQTSAGWQSLPPFGHVYVPRGGVTGIYDTDPAQPLGRYVARVRGAGGGTARAAFELLP